MLRCDVYGSVASPNTRCNRLVVETRPTAKVMDVIAGMVAKEPGLDAATLVERVEQQQGVRVHQRTIERALARLKKKRR
jgi:hypothetical protein